MKINSKEDLHNFLDILYKYGVTDVYLYEYFGKLTKCISDVCNYNYHDIRIIYAELDTLANMDSFLLSFDHRFWDENNKKYYFNTFEKFLKLRAFK